MVTSARQPPTVEDQLAVEEQLELHLSSDKFSVEKNYNNEGLNALAPYPHVQPSLQTKPAHRLPKKPR